MKINIGTARASRDILLYTFFDIFFQGYAGYVLTSNSC